MSIRLHLFSVRCLGWLLLLALPLPALGALDNTAISLGWNYQQKGLSEWRIMDVSGASVLTEAAVELKNSTQEVAHMVAFMNETISISPTLRLSSTIPIAGQCSMLSTTP